MLAHATDGVGIAIAMVGEDLRVNAPREDLEVSDESGKTVMVMPFGDVVSESEI